MADEYKVTVKIIVTKDVYSALVHTTETTWQSLTFVEMANISADYYRLLARISKEIDKQE